MLKICWDISETLPPPLAKFYAKKSSINWGDLYVHGVQRLTTQKNLLFFHLGVDITELILMFYSMTITNNKSQYSVITTESDDHGNEKYYVEFFLKSRKGLNDAYKYAFKQPNWTIYFGGEVVDSSESFDANQVDGDFKTLCTQ